MKENIKTITIILLVLLLYFLFFIIQKFNFHHSMPPIIHVPESVLHINVKDPEKKYLEGISVSDDIDDNLTPRVSVESISSFDENMERTVTYIVFDSDDNVARATRKIAYTNYQKPKFDIIEPLLSTVHMFDQYLENIRATSTLDGDLTSQIMLVDNFEENGIDYVVFSVTDSCGVEERIQLKITNVVSNPTIQINLNKYLIRVSKGTEINPMDYIDSIHYLGMENNQLIKEMIIQDDYDANVEGIYEFIYRIDEMKDFGLTKLTVIVE